VFFFFVYSIWYLQLNILDQLIQFINLHYEGYLWPMLNMFVLPVSLYRQVAKAFYELVPELHSNLFKVPSEDLILLLFNDVCT